MSLDRFVAFFRAPGRARRWAKSRSLGLALMFAGVLHQAGQAEETDPNDLVPPEGKQWWQKYASVKEWQGIWETSTSGSNASNWGSGMSDSRYEARSHGSFLLKRPKEYAVGGTDDPRRGILIWRGEGTATGKGNGTYSRWETSRGVRHGEEWQQLFQGTMQQRQIEFTLWYTKKPSRLAKLHPGTYDQKDLPKGAKTGYALDYRGDFAEHRAINETFQQKLHFWFLGDTKDMWPVVEAGPGVLEFSYEEKGGGATGNQSLTGAVKKNHVVLIPVFDNLEVEVTIEGYDDWRPKGTIADPKKPGNKLTARATLKNKDGAPPAELPAVRRFTFELKETSREPGICMNWPLNAKDNDPDLRLAGGLMGGELSQEDQKLVVTTVPKDEQDQPYSEAEVDSYDFGGRAELRVTCELQDGREITGLIKNEKGEEDLVRIPKTDGPGWIAEGWRQKKGVTDLPDNDDEEKVEGQDYRGDGFTLYEEYRGFVENGVHIEADPKKKDLFIVNMADVASREGLSLLERIAKLRVHGRLREDKEMNTTARLMNGNHRAAPHRVDQHGVILSNSADINNYKIVRGGAQVPVEAADPNKAARPRDTSYCYVVAPDARYGVFSATSRKFYDLTHLSVNQLYAAAVAHELLHAIGVDHHGEQLMDIRWGVFQSSDNPKNPTGKPRFLDEALVGDGPPVFFLWEDNGASVAEDQQAVFNQYVAESVSGDKDWYRNAAQYWCNRAFFVGKPQGTDSGDEPCVMRYYFATAYAMKGKANTFYVIRPGTKQAETTVCTGSKGTGGNAAGHAPQPRFGDAVGGRGNCFAQICPNDAIPPRSTKLK